MKVQNKDGKGNPYHDDNTGEFTSIDEATMSDATSNDILSGKSIGDKTFDIKKSNASFYDGIFDPNEIVKTRGEKGDGITKKDYYKFEKGKDCKLSYMTGKEYLDKCVKDIFGSNYDSVVTNNAWINWESVDAYAEAMKRGEVFPLCYLDYDSQSQEGRHRALAFIKAFGENEKMPVLEVYKTKATDEEIEDYCNRAYGGTNYWFDYVKGKLRYEEDNPYEEQEETEKDNPYEEEEQIASDDPYDNIDLEDYLKNDDLLGDFLDFDDLKPNDIQQSNIKEYTGDYSNNDSYKAQEMLKKSYNELIDNDSTRLYRYREWANNSNNDYKDYIYNDFKNGKKEAALNLWFNKYKLLTGQYDLSFNDFLNTPITLYRATNKNEKENQKNPFFSYATNRSDAERFLTESQGLYGNRTGDIEEVSIKPIDTFGMFPSDENEIIIPNKAYEEFNDKVENTVDGLIDYSNSLGVKLPYSKEELIDLFKKDKDIDQLTQLIFDYIGKKSK